MIFETKEDVDRFLSEEVSDEDLGKLRKKELEFIVECLQLSLPAANPRKDMLVTAIASSVVKVDIPVDPPMQVEVPKLKIEREKMKIKPGNTKKYGRRWKGDFAWRVDKQRFYEKKPKGSTKKPNEYMN